MYNSWFSWRPADFPCLTCLTLPAWWYSPNSDWSNTDSCENLGPSNMTGGNNARSGSVYLWPYWARKSWEGHYTNEKSLALQDACREREGPSSVPSWGWYPWDCVRSCDRYVGIQHRKVGSLQRWYLLMYLRCLATYRYCFTWIGAQGGQRSHDCK